MAVGVGLGSAVEGEQEAGGRRSGGVGGRLTASGRVGIFLEKCRVGLRSWIRELRSGWEA